MRVQSKRTMKMRRSDKDTQEDDEEVEEEQRRGGVEK